jgi:hypothetical protein
VRLAYWVWLALTLAAVALLARPVSPLVVVGAVAWVMVTQFVLYSVAWWDVRTDGYVLTKGDDRRWRVGAQRLDGSIEWLAPAGRRP